MSPTLRMFNRLFVRLPILLGTMFAALLTMGSIAGAQDEPCRQFIEAENMTIDGAGYAITTAEKLSGGAGVCVNLPDAETVATGGQLVAQLRRKLPPGQYLVYVHVARLEGEALKKQSGSPIKIDVYLGMSRSTLTLKRGQYSSYGGIVIDASRPFETLALKWLSPEKDSVLDTVILTSRPADMVEDRRKRQFITVPHPAPAAEETSVSPFDQPEPANWLANGSFEVGISSNDWSTQYQLCYTMLPSFWDDKTAFHGKHSLAVQLYPTAMRFKPYSPELPTTFRLMHQILPLKPGKTYHFRGMFRSDKPVSLAVWAVSAKNIRKQLARVNARVGDQWRPVEFSFQTDPNTPRWYMLYLHANSAGPATLWVDALTLSAEEHNAFVPAAAVEADVTWTAPGKVFHADAPTQFDLHACNYTDQPATASIRYRVKNFFDDTVLDQCVDSWELPAGETATKSLALKLGKTGLFRLLIGGTATSADGKITLTQKEYTFCVLPKPPADMVGNWGSYITVQPEPIENMSRAGIHRTTTLSCSNEMLNNWARMEPQYGQYVWVDHRVDATLARDVTIMANLETQSMPKWAVEMAKDEENPLKIGGGPRHKNMTFSRKAWAEFVEAVARHYKGRIHEWLIVDEPYHYFSPEEYFELVKVSYAAAKKGDPNCRLLIHGGYYSAWRKRVEELGIADYCDGVSGYARTAAQAKELRDFAEKYHKYVRNVEYGWYASGYLTLKCPGSLKERSPYYIINAQAVITKALRSVAWSGALGLCRYDARFPGGDFTQFHAYKSLFEYDGGLKPAGVALAVLSQKLDGFHGVGQRELHDQLECHLFENDTEFALAVWAVTGRLFLAEFDCPDGVRAVDIMGNPVATNKSRLWTSSVVYLIGPKRSLPATEAVLKKFKPRTLVTFETAPGIDPKTGQYQLTVRVTNHDATLTIEDRPLQLTASPGRYATATLVLPAWDNARTVSIPPGKTITTTFTLNAFRGEKVHPRQATLTLRLGKGLMLQQTVENVFPTAEKGQ